MLRNKGFQRVKSPKHSSLFQRKEKKKYFEMQQRRKDAHNNVLNSMQPSKLYLTAPIRI